jgi:hypothetical protein
VSPRARRTALFCHVVSSVGWLGAIVAYLALALAAIVRGDDGFARAAYVSMELVGFVVIIPLSLATLATGVIQSLLTEWGLVRHWWIVIKLALALVGTAILLVHMTHAVKNAAALAASAEPLANLGAMRAQLVVHAAGGLVILLVATWLSVFKPGGKTPWARSV